MSRIFLILVFMVMTVSSCSFLSVPQEVMKTLWGSSTRALEEARTSAVVKTYDTAYGECFHYAMKVSDANQWVIFKKDEIKGFMILLNIPGCVDTTEVGVFFVRLSARKTRIEVSSLSTNAKRKAAKVLFDAFDRLLAL